MPDLTNDTQQFVAVMCVVSMTPWVLLLVAAALVRTARMMGWMYPPRLE